jgi:hypothetical protein
MNHAFIVMPAPACAKPERSLRRSADDVSFAPGRLTRSREPAGCACCVSLRDMRELRGPGAFAERPDIGCACLKPLIDTDIAALVQLDTCVFKIDPRGVGMRPAATRMSLPSMVRSPYARPRACRPRRCQEPGFHIAPLGPWIPPRVISPKQAATIRKKLAAHCSGSRVVAAIDGETPHDQGIIGGNCTSTTNPLDQPPWSASPIRRVS